MRRNLQDMVTVITGASSGIGRALAVQLASRGSKLFLGARRLDRLQQLASGFNVDHCCLATDVSRPENCRRIIEAAQEKFGRVDTVVCNAGYGFARPFDAMSEEDIRQIFETNFFGTTECCRNAVGFMRRQNPRDGFRGQLMIVSSACAMRGLPYFSAYAATKAAQLSLAEGLRVELKSYAIAVTCVHPMLCQTDFFTTANDLSGMCPDALAPGKKQSPEFVAARMVRAIEKPCREVWPKAFSRLSLHIAAAIPGVVDKVLFRMRDKMLNDHLNKESLSQRDSESPISQVPARETSGVS
jgi:short-subunit dehydrogenase